MIGRLALLLTAVALLVASGARAYADERVALVIGNAVYEHAGRLNNAVNDARAVAEALRRIGFEVTAVEDQGKSALEGALKVFARQARGADVALVYYSGHGMEIGGSNYVVPIDAALETDVDVDFEAVALDSLLRVVEGAKRLRIVILDACRNNPLAAQMQVASGTRGIGRGLARIEPAGQTLVAYAAKAGTVADDGSNGHSPYTTALLKHIEEPGLEVRFLFAMVRDEVLAETGNAQEPFTYGSLGAEQLFLVAPAGAAEAASVSAAPQPVTSGLDKDALFWQSIQDSGDVAAFRAYLDAFPDGTFATLARLRLDGLAAAPAPIDVATPTMREAVVSAEAEPASPSPDEADVPPHGAEEQQLAALPPAEAAQLAVLPPTVADEAVPEPDTADDIRSAQRRLKELGYVIGKADGKLGPKTRAAIRAFQQRAGLAVNGEVTPALLEALMSDSAPAAPKPKPEVEQASPDDTPLSPKAGTQPVEAVTPDALFWQSIQASSDPADFADYLARFPQGDFASLAARRLAALTPAVEPPAPEAPKSAAIGANAGTRPLPKASACPTFEEWSIAHPGVRPTGLCSSLGSKQEVARCLYRKSLEASGCGDTGSAASEDVASTKTCLGFTAWKKEYWDKVNNSGSGMQQYRAYKENSGCKSAY